MSDGLIPPAWRLLLWTIDGLAAGAGLLVAHHLAYGSWPAGPDLLVVVLAVPLGVLLMLACDGSALPRGSSPWSPALRGAAAAAGGAAAAALAGSLCGLGDAWRPMVAVAAAAAAAIPALAVRVVVWFSLRQRGPRRALIIGPLDCRIRLREHLAQHPEAGLLAVADVGPGVAPLSGIPTWAMDGLDAAIAETGPDEILLSTGMDDQLLVLETMGRLLGRPLLIRFIPDSDSLPMFFPRPADIAGLPAIDLSRGPLSPGAEIAKWAEDVIVAAVAMALLCVPMLIIAIAVKLTSPGPVFFVQERHGRNGRPIRVLKFRTMRSEACTPDVETGQFRQATKGDMRVTPFGHFLRNSSLDEIPQFINVLCGDMSVVGPRPHAIAHNLRFARDIGELMRRHYVKPGITGLAQISGSRGETRTVEDMRRRVALDLEYLRRWSLWLDLTIIARTLVAGWINRHP